MVRRGSHRPIALLISVFASLWTASGMAEEQPPGLLDNGLISLTLAVPGMTPVSDYGGDTWNRGTLFGDPWGERKALYERGITIDASVTQVLQGVAAGGSGEGDSPQYNALFDYGITFDTAKLGLWSGGLFVANAQSNLGTALQGQPGSISPVNYTALFPRPFESSTELMEFYAVQALPLNLSLVLGRVDAVNFVDRNRFANDPRTQFLNTSLNNTPLFGSFLSFSTYAALLNVPVNENLNLAFAAFNPDTQPGDYGGTWDNYGLGFAPDVSWNLADDLGGTLGLIVLYDSKDALALDNPYFVPGVIEGDAPTKNGNWIVNLNLEQYLWKPEAAGGKEVRTRSFDYQEPGLGTFLRFAYTPGDRNPFNLFASGGLSGRGLIAGRPYDRMGVGAYALMASNDLQDQPFIGQAVEDEVGVEAFYNFAMTPWAQISFDAQWIDPGIAANDPAVVLGTRLFLQF